MLQGRERVHLMGNALSMPVWLECYNNKFSSIITLKLTYKIKSEWIYHQNVIKALFWKNKTTLSQTNVITKKDVIKRKADVVLFFALYASYIHLV